MRTKAEGYWNSDPKALEPSALPPPKTRPESGGEGSGPQPEATVTKKESARPH